jgi:hypothetical protein
VGIEMPADFAAASQWAPAFASETFPFGQWIFMVLTAMLWFLGN